MSEKDKYVDEIWAIHGKEVAGKIDFYEANRLIQQQIRQAQLDVLVSLKEDTEVLDDTVVVNWKWIVEKINQLKQEFDTKSQRY